ncbi:phosphatase [Aureococcus anophagefferens]|nr:phosphatase [Aureococcus anophagefferens]
MFTAGEEAASLLADDSRPIADYGAQSPAAAPSHARTRRYAAGALCALAVVALAGARDAPAPARAQTAFAARPALAWEAANEYTARLGAIAREYPWQGADFQVVDCLRPFSLALTVDHRAQETVAWSLEAPDREVSTHYGPRRGPRPRRRRRLRARHVLRRRADLAYWDWTIESKLVEDRVISSPLDTPLWTADWFGSLNYAEAPVVVGPHYGLSTDEFFRRGFEAWAIRDGRWAYATVKRYDDVSGVSYPLNSYGFLRSPWNNNPSPYVTRASRHDADDADAGLSPAKSWPTCTNLYDFLLPNATAVDFMTHLEDMTVHANVHQVLAARF